MSDTHAQTVAYVRESFLEQAPPPERETGPIRWLRVNLFSNWFYAILTLLSIYVVYTLLSDFLPWLFNGVWNASDIRECREILQGATGGCFAVLAERWNQLLFGFSFPSDQYWRIVVAFLLFCIAAAPVLFAAVPRVLFVVTGLFPFVAYYLIWGGTILTPLAVLVGVVAGYFAYRRLVDQSFAMGLLGGVVAGLIVWWLAAFVPQDQPSFLALRPIPSRDLGGFALNLMLGVICVSLSLPFGILLALGRQSRLPIIKWICVVFIEFVRGVPLITLLFVANVVLAYFLPPGSNFDLILRVIIMITMFASAYIAEVIRGGLAALPRGQYEAADSLGLDYTQAMRLIILPQALKISIPGIVNVAVGLFKDTTLVSIISMFDLVGMIRGPILASTEWNGVYWELYGFAALLFFIVCYAISQYSQWLERQLNTEHR
ncbi:L-glutamine ABC transporter membrane protein /L-glutamate ABC transporter membrane protein /L-aspartate ABC transporter membrane protein /L-asparagine ABC transporter membrane protein [Palleronia aestuarii]|uniref:L-glutamine ABC transporter membrane protein /L-glutamate ABC transporter membrane protein /L-aspartate ABC transporter membrane protein /L-asparagine ABC transporter membrane protein n=1 Tax=Palleronia aestuarii TaxID=568105 RepID=A0A2W7MXL0_9RHOB|nr:amino acid ABC transporter permease [Palleronia aestuarii]PZX12273.1 L-glutamine ABC transporter membrane protein /L-glutamate ABC transporter membrane protein /L-aspartate ABC transporter membrane protein /L-asparagine ABC transporter membrane protein [Palleronia aestuarii]